MLYVIDDNIGINWVTIKDVNTVLGYVLTTLGSLYFSYV